MTFYIKGFIDNRKTLIIAPAGYGKTHSIVNSLKYIEKNKLGKHLILNHTHAGIASIKEKLNKEKISNLLYHIETIDGYCQKYVNSFIDKSIIPSIQTRNDYYKFIREKTLILFQKKFIKDIIKESYAGIFVDEYQDCGKIQHNIVMALSDVLPIHLLGDPMQGIFGFNEELVNFNRDLSSFIKFELSDPQRWKRNQNNENLGICFKSIREKLEKKETINLDDYKSNIEINVEDENNKYSPKNQYWKKIYNLNGDSLLLIYPNSENPNSKNEIGKKLSPKFKILEAIDANDLYKCSIICDDIQNKNNKFLYLKKLLSIMFNKTDINTWFNGEGVKNKASESDKLKSKKLSALINMLNNNDVSYKLIFEILKELKDTLHFKVYRTELFYSLVKSLEIASYEKISVYDAMVQHRNKVRIIGRKVYGKCIGTTLLTKGLEFDTVVILDCQKFKDYKHFYVAITRACKKLIIFTNTKQLKFN